MKEGLWINALTGDWRWITEHASWIQVPANAMSLGMAEDAALRLSAMPWDFNGPGRMAILLAAMAHGFVRVRGHGATCSFEHTLPQDQAIEAARGFMAANFGPRMNCRFSALHTMEVVEVLFEDLLHHQDRSKFWDLLEDSSSY